MKKVFSLFAAMCMAVGLFAESTVLFNYTVSTEDAEQTAFEVTGGQVYLGATGKLEADKGYKMDGDSGTKYAKLSFTNALKAGDVITITEYAASTPGGSDYGVSVAKTIPSEGNFVAVETAYLPAGADYKGVAVPCQITVAESLAGATELYLFRAVGKSTYLVAVKVEGEASAPEVKTVITAEKLWEVAAPGAGVARQGMGMENALYYHKSGDGVYKVTYAEGTATTTLVVADTTSGIGAHAIAKDDAGNIVLFGSAGFPTGAATPLFISILRKGETTPVAITCPELVNFDRTDFIAAGGDVFSADGGHLYVMNNNGAAAFDITITNGATATATALTGLELANQQNVMMYKEGEAYYYTSASKGVMVYDGAAATVVSGLTNINAANQVVGATRFMLLGKEIYAYHVGNNYTGEFSIFNKTDNELIADMNETTVFGGTTSSGGALRGVWLNAERIDDNNYMLYAWHSHCGGMVYKVSAVQAAEVALSVNDAAMGSVEGAGDKALNSSVTVTATPNAGYSFVGWTKAGETVSTDASYTFTATENVALVAVFQAEENKTLTLAVNDATLGTITMPEGIELGANSVVYGTEVELIAVPAEGKTFLNWTKGEEVYATTATITVTMTEELALTANFTSIVAMAYELNGGITNDYGWTCPQDMYNDVFAAYNAALNMDKVPGDLATIKTYADPLVGEGTIATAFYTSASDQHTVVMAHADFARFLWLVDYLDAANAATEGASLASGGPGNLRYSLGAFFVDGQRASWPKSANFATNGVSSYAAYQAAWGHAYANPTEITGEFVLNAPYKEGFTFDGWYANADFSGEKVVTVSTETTPGTLYAKWIEYIPTIAEVKELPANTQTKMKGVVLYADGRNVYVQDATGGNLVYLTAANANVVAGKTIIVSGKTTTYKGAPELTNATVESIEDGTLPTAQVKTLEELCAEPLKYFAQLVKVEGAKIVKYDSFNNPYLGPDSIKCHKMVLDPANYPVGAKVNITAVASYYNNENQSDVAASFQFVGDAAGIVLASAAAHDTYQYPARGVNGEYTLENKWIYSVVEDNYADNVPGPSDNVRGMAVKDGKMYFVNRSNASLTVVDGATGYMLDPIMITGDHLFEAQGEDEAWASATTLPFNDIKFDNAGNCLIGACVSGGQHFMVYKVDLTTGAATLLIDERLYDNPEFGEELQEQATAWRFDAFGVYGDVNGDAVVMAADANSFNVYKWTIEGGVAGMAEQIDASLDPTTDESLLITNGEVTVVPNSAATQIFVLEGGYFYVDGHYCLPMLYDGEGYLADDFVHCPTGVAVVNNEGDTCRMNQGHNGLCEFQVGEDYFLVMAATNTIGTPTSAFALYKYADGNKSFSEMTPLWYFPANGMGSLTNGCRTAVPSVEVEGNVATIYVYTNNNGYGVYELTVGNETALENAAVELGAEKVVENGQLYIIKNGVRYTVLGAVVK